MKLYQAPGSCSQAAHIAINAAGLPCELVNVDIPTHKTEAGEDFYKINAKGYVPALILDDGEVLTENVAIIDWAAGKAPHLIPAGPLGRIRMIEALAFMTTELHKPYLSYAFLPGDEMKAINKMAIEQRYATIAGAMKGAFMLGDTFSGADAYLFVMVGWGNGFGIAPPQALLDYYERVAKLPFVHATLKAEGFV